MIGRWADQRAADLPPTAGPSDNGFRNTDAAGRGFRGVTNAMRSVTSQSNMKTANASHVPSTTVQVPPMKVSSRLRMPGGIFG